MEHQLYQKRRVAMIRVEPYLAAYARRKFETDPATGSIRIPDSFDLYHCVSLPGPYSRFGRRLAVDGAPPSRLSPHRQ